MNAFLEPQPFTPYGVSHGAVLALFAVGAWILVQLGRRQSATEGTLRFRRGLALVIVGFQLPLQVFSMLPPHWNIARSLPFQLCDLAWMAAVCALWTRRWWACALTYYWGLTLTPQAMLTPALPFDFPHVQFIMFWGMHLLVVWAAIYLTWGVGERPDWRGFRLALAVTVGWSVVVLLFNALAGTNYLFVNAKPPTPSLLDLLGEWPWYLVTEFALIVTVWAGMTWPFARKHDRRILN